MQDRDSLTCDFAEYYHLTDWEGLPVQTLAALASGLPPYARSKQTITGQKVSDETLLLALLADRVGMIAWMMTEDGARGRNRPESLFQLLSGQKQDEEPEFTVYQSGDEFEAARQEILRRGGYIQ